MWFRYDMNPLIKAVGTSKQVGVDEQHVHTAEVIGHNKCCSSPATPCHAALVLRHFVIGIVVGVAPNCKS